MQITRALIVRAPHVERIVTGKKLMEMRSRHTNIRGRVGIIEPSKGIIGSVEIVDSVDYSSCISGLKNEFMQRLHRVPSEEYHKLDKWCYGWHLLYGVKYEKPIPYEHPQGAVVWVKLRGEINE